SFRTASSAVGLVPIMVLIFLAGVLLLLWGKILGTPIAEQKYRYDRRCFDADAPQWPSMFPWPSLLLPHGLTLRLSANSALPRRSRFREHGSEHRRCMLRKLPR